MPQIFRWLNYFSYCALELLNIYRSRR